MIPKKRTFKQHVARSLLIGIIVSILIPELMAGLLLPSSWNSPNGPLKNPQYPTYLHDIAPPFSQATSGHVYPDPLNIGMDIILYSYGLDYFDPGYAPWDPTQTDTPPSVNITRFRFGFPWRSLTWDDLSTGSSVNIPAVMDYHIKMYDRAGIDRGIGVSFISPGRRLPIAPIWGGLLLNIIFWSVAWYVPGAIRRTVRTFVRARRGLCLSCGYEVEDLETCPECGTDTAPASGALKPDC